MKLWIAGTVAQVKAVAATGLASAIVTNPTVVAQWCAAEKKPLEDIALDVVQTTGLPLYIQLHGPTAATFLAEARALRRLNPLILPKLPSTTEGFIACRALADEGSPVLVTTVCSVNQAYLAAVAGATSICPYFARLGESGQDPAAFIATVAALYARHGIKTEILPASIRTLAQAEAAMVAGASGVIIFDELYRQLCDHGVTASSLQGFEADWAKTLYRFENKL
jgi:TalC/MipB family fructose-6-phosphate aldolase